MGPSTIGFGNYGGGQLGPVEMGHGSSFREFDGPPLSGDGHIIGKILPDSLAKRP